MLLGLIWIPEYGVRSAHFIAPFVLGILTLLALGLYEALWAKNPLLHPFLFKRVRTFTMLLVIGFVAGLQYYGLIAFLPTFLSTVYNNGDATQTGIDSIPFGTGGLFGGITASLVLSLYGRKVGTRSIILVLVIIQTVFIPLMAVAPLDNKAMALAFSFFGGVGKSSQR